MRDQLINIKKTRHPILAKATTAKDSKKQIDQS
jgi:hypothetical protein